MRDRLEGRHGLFSIARGGIEDVERYIAGIA
jgi:hypothetical protein